MNTNWKIVIGVVALIAIIALFTPAGKTVVQTLGGATNFDRLVVLNNTLRVSGILIEDFTISTTTPTRAALTNPTGNPTIMCDGRSLAVYASSTVAATDPLSLLAPSFKYAVGTTTSATAYSANLIASTTVATSTNVLNGAALWPILLPAGSSITLSVGDALSNASSTHYGNWVGQISVNCWELGQ